MDKKREIAICEELIKDFEYKIMLHQSFIDDPPEYGIVSVSEEKKTIKKLEEKQEVLRLAIDSLKERPAGKWISKAFDTNEINVKAIMYECPFCHRRYDIPYEGCLCGAILREE